MKVCTKCGKEKEPSEFYVDKRYNRPMSWCKLCMRESTKARTAKYKEESVEYLGGRCIICGYNKYHGALEFHHLNPNEKDPNFVSIKNWTFERRIEELNKCVLLCANCHREVEAGITQI